jgi:hypothetical protein
MVSGEPSRVVIAETLATTAGADSGRTNRECWVDQNA